MNQVNQIDYRVLQESDSKWRTAYKNEKRAIKVAYDEYIDTYTDEPRVPEFLCLYKNKFYVRALKGGDKPFYSYFIAGGWKEGGVILCSLSYLDTSTLENFTKVVMKGIAWNDEWNLTQMNLRWANTSLIKY